MWPMQEDGDFFSPLPLVGLGYIMGELVRVYSECDLMDWNWRFQFVYFSGLTAA